MDKIRNFAIIAHIDHGKSTLADRFLEKTQTIAKNKIVEQFLDQNPISRERGITIKLAPVRMHYVYKNEDYILNLIDTPGHMDFSYEVSRTLAATEGAILLVDATQGIQAQTVAHYYAAKKENLVIIPVLNKIDSPAARIEEVEQELVDMFGFSKQEMLHVSAKTGENVEELLNAVIERIPSPKGDVGSTLRALIFDAEYDEHRGVVAFVRVVDGKLIKGQELRLLQTEKNIIASDVGYFLPNLVSKSEILSGEIGYIVTGVKDIREARVGDTITIPSATNVSALPGYQTPKPMVFFGVYPRSTNDLPHLKEALSKLMLNDASLTIGSEYSAFLGTGFRIGFLGLLHADIVKERLEKEGKVTPLFTMPRVLYKEEDEKTYEPYMSLTVFTPADYVGPIMTLCQKKKGNLLDMQYHQKNVILKYEMPYSMFIRGLSNEIKSVSSGFGSLDYEISDYKQADLVNLEIAVNLNNIDVLSDFVYKDEANFVAREKVDRLKEFLPRQQVRQIIQAKVGATILARSEIPPFRKDVLQKMSGGDRTRKDKLLEAQKKGKEKMGSTSRIDIPQKALLSMFEK